MRRPLLHLLATIACLVAWPALAMAQESSEHLVSELRTVRPASPGLELEVIERGRFMRLENKTGGTVVVEGYDGEQFLRFGDGGRVEVNTRSPSKYVSEDRFGRRPVPARADSAAAPRWEAVSRDGAYQWFDHRIHYMAPGKPEEVSNEDVRTKIFDWTVPLTVDGRPVRAAGTLTWEPDESSGSSAAPIIAGGVALAVLVAGVVLLLRRRRRPSSSPTSGPPTKEAW